ncbi:MAG: CHAT domain-containing protein [Cyanobacteria bacterium P01_F01_bin.143]
MNKIKRFLGSLRRYPSYQFFKSGKLRKVVSTIVLTLLGLVSAFMIPAWSQSAAPEQSQLLTQQGKEFYEAGQLEQAIATWTEAAELYASNGDFAQETANLINTATAQQALGLYGDSCETVLQAFDIEEINCFDLLDDAQSLEQRLSTQGISFSETDSSFVFLQPLVEEPDSLSKATGLLRLGDYFINSNYPQVALATTDLSLQIARRLDDPRQETAALLSLGNTVRAIAVKEQNQFPPQTIALDNIVNQRGSVDVALEPYQPAIQYYEDAANLAQYRVNSLKAEMNHLSMLLDIQEFWQKAIDDLTQNLDVLGIRDRSFQRRIDRGTLNLKSGLDRELQPQIVRLTRAIRPQLDNLPLTRSGVFARINFAQSLIRQEILDVNTANILADAIDFAQQLNNPIAEAEATGYLGYLYEQDRKYQEARLLTEKALALAPTIEYPEIAYRWHAQLGRILALQDDREGALASYKASFNTISALRSDLATTPVENIFREYIALLLEESPTEDQLEEAREVLESLQISELDNFFSDPCSPVAEETVLIDDVDQQAAVIYPIILEDRLEVIVTLPGQDLQLYTTEITPKEVNSKISELRRKTLTNPGFAEAFRGARGPQEQAEVQQSLNRSLDRNILPLAEEIYGWLIARAEPLFQANEIKTLVFVLDGSLRSIPMSLLYDGEQYLIEKDYNIALTSGLQLTNPQPLKRQPIKVLAAGTTRAAIGFPPIPKVEDELNFIGNLFPDSTVLLNADFTSASLREQLEAENYPIVHLATHGQFGSTSDQTFILSGSELEDDLKINVKQFDDLLRVGNRRGSQSIELLVLSACETAQGDNQAILGLAGVAVRAGAQSTIATLWGANDEATAELMGYFYQNLNENQEISKAKALRDAQLALLQNPDSQYSHPYYWAPFVLIGNWL